MAVRDLTDPAAVEAALDEFDRLGRDAFLRKYGFKRSRSYFVVRGDARYDSKAIAGAAYGHQYPDRGPLRPRRVQRRRRHGAPLLEESASPCAATSRLTLRPSERRGPRPRTPASLDQPEHAGDGAPRPPDADRGPAPSRRLVRSRPRLSPVGRGPRRHRPQNPRAMDAGFRPVPLARPPPAGTRSTSSPRTAARSTSRSSKARPLRERRFRQRPASVIAERAGRPRSGSSATGGRTSSSGDRPQGPARPRRGVRAGQCRRLPLPGRCPARRRRPPRGPRTVSRPARAAVRGGRRIGTPPTNHLPSRLRRTCEHEAWEALRCGDAVDEAELTELVETLEERRQVVLAGPPGTGKTRVATGRGTLPHRRGRAAAGGWSSSTRRTATRSSSRACAGRRTTVATGLRASATASSRRWPPTMDATTGTTCWSSTR